MAAGGRPTSASDWSEPGRGPTCSQAAAPDRPLIGRGRPEPYVLAWKAGGERSVHLTSGPRPGWRPGARPVLAV
jgi:hypothetical protein